MTNVSSLDYVALNLSGDNYLKWALDTKIMLHSKGIGECIVDGNNESVRNRYKAIFIIRHHLTESLKDQYLTIEDPLDLWKELKKRYDHQRTVVLPKVKFDWLNLRFMDFKSVDEYNSALFKIVSKLKLCGEIVTEKDMLEKTFSTFHSSNVLLQQQYRERGFATYSDLIACLLLAEQNNSLVLANSEMRPAGSTPLPEANMAADTKKETEANYVQRYQRHNGRGYESNRGPGRGHGRGHGRGRYHPYGRGNGRGSDSNRGPDFNRRGSNFNRGQGRGQGRGHGNQTGHKSGPTKSVCHRCGMDNHWAKTCRTPRHLIELYQASLKGKNPEANMIQHEHEHDNEGDFDHEKDDLMDNDDLTKFETSDLLK